MGLSAPDLEAIGARLRARHYAVGFDVGRPVGDGWLTVADLVGGGRPSPALEGLVAATAASFPPGSPPAIRARVAAQRFCYLWGWSVVAATLGPQLLEDVAPDPSGENVAVRVHGHHPGEVALLTAAVAPTGPGPSNRMAWWEDRILAGHLDVLHAAVAARWRLGRRGLRGDLATDVSGVARVVGALTGDPEAAARAARSALDRPSSRLRGLGVVGVVGDTAHRAVVYARNTCCLIVKAVPGAYCTNCPLLDPGARDRRSTPAPAPEPHLSGTTAARRSPPN